MTPDSALRVTPLTKRKQTGELYERRPEVELQLGQIAAAGGQIDLANLAVRERGNDGFIYDETIVYLIRQVYGLDDELLNALYSELDRRTNRLLGKFRRYFENNKSGFEDLEQEVAMAILTKILDIRSESADYAQVNYGDFAILVANTFCRGFVRRLLKQPQLYGDFEREGDEPDEPIENTFAGNDSRTDDQLVARIAIAKLPNDIRIAAVMYYLDGWQIESNSPSVGTISGYFGVTPRTIRNWLTKAAEILMEYRNQR